MPKKKELTDAEKAKVAADKAVLEAANLEDEAREDARRAEAKAERLGNSPRYPVQLDDRPQDPQPRRGSNIVPDPVDPRNPRVNKKKLAEDKAELREEEAKNFEEADVVEPVVEPVPVVVVDPKVDEPKDKKLTTRNPDAKPRYTPSFGRTPSK